MSINIKKFENLGDQFSEQVTPKNYVNDLLNSVNQCLDHECYFFNQLIRTTFDNQNPIFTQREFAKSFWLYITSSQNKIENIVIQDALAEMKGSTSLARLSQSCTFNDKAKLGILKHSQDEGRHSFLYIQLAQLCFPENFNDTKIKYIKNNIVDVVKNEKKQIPPNITHEILIDHIIQMNMVEIRTRTNINLLSPILLSLCPEEHRNQVEEILISLSYDESRHIGYTAELLNDWAESGYSEIILQLYNKRLEQFSALSSS